MKKFILVLALLSIPTFGLMLRSGIYTMHDFHVFRQQQFEKCLIQTKNFPCRWSPDAGLGYGEPVFNFYGQFPYWIGEIFRIMKLSVLDSVKANFILSILASSMAMYFLARKFWSNTGALVSALFYAYAPYRAVDIWVRGALPESLAFVFFPLILLFIKEFIETNKNKYLFWLILSLSGLTLTHNLSLLIFIPFGLIWGVYWWLRSTKSIHIIYDLISAGLVGALLSAFYLLPVLFESSLVTLNQTTIGYYDFHIHYATLKQLFLSTFWGFGGSTWGPNDTMSFAVGQMHWILAVLLVVFVFIKKRNIETLFFVSLGFLAIFLTHGKSDLIWNIVKPMAYIQFPWRFLTMSTLFLSLAIGSMTKFLPRILTPLLLCLLLLLNTNMFRPDIWRNITDTEQFSGRLWDEQRSSALSDFWPKSASSLPNAFAPFVPEVMLNTRYPIVYFPGWVARVDGKKINVFPSGDLGLVTVQVPQGKSVTLSFEDTPVRRIGNIASLITLLCLIIWIWKKS
ncbi:MAG: 6-pyruvoyl-tetrahydropterin synthase-related protein [Candidatus Amesbacteria bacterium]|nr:6-pyruvoyl-tetrahydropterin synthase-related protein [Candidatus Amesbacteria bacterium]